MWIELHTRAVNDALYGLRMLGLQTETLDLSEYGRAGRIFRNDVLCGAVVEAREQGAPQGWLPFRSVSRIEALNAVVPPVRLPGGTRAIVVEDGRSLGLWEGGPDGPLEVRGLSDGWALIVDALPTGEGWTQEDKVAVHRSGWAVVKR